MPIYGGYETVAELHRGALGAVWSARRAGASEEPVFAIRTCQPDGAILGEVRAAAALEAFLGRAQAQQRAAQSVPLAESRWAQVYEIGRVPATETAPAGVFMVTDLATRGTTERLIAARTQLDGRTLAVIVDGVVAGLRQIASPAGGGRSHGRIEPSNVLLLAGTPGQPPPRAARKDGIAKSLFTRVALADPAIDGDSDRSRAAKDDQLALGRLIHLLVLHEPFRGQLPLESGPQWSQLGKSGDSWRQLTERLLERSSDLVPLEDLVGEVKKLRGMRRSRTPLIVGVAALALVAGGVGVYVLAERAFQRQAAPLPETLWNPDAAARWAQLCDAYRTWYGSFLTRLEQRPPTASAQHRTRRAWYAALDRELGSILAPHALIPGKGTDPWTLAGVEAGADLTTLSASPTARARSDSSVERTRVALESIDALLKELPEKWPALARFGELAQLWESRGWKTQAEYVRRIAVGASPAVPGLIDLAASFDELLRTRTMIERVEGRWVSLKQAADAIARAEDPLLKTAPAAFGSMLAMAASSSDPAMVSATPTRDDVVLIEQSIDIASELASRLQAFLENEWSGIDADSFRSGERYGQLAAAPASAETLEGWLFEVRGHARLDPALDPRAGWDEAELLKPVNLAVAELAKPLLNVPVDAITSDRIQNLRAGAHEISPDRLPWNRRNRDRIETHTVRIRREVAAVQAELEARIAVRMQELATTAEEVREQLRSRASVAADSPALNAAWIAGRDRLLAVHTGLDFEALKQAARSLEGEISWAAAAFGSPRQADDLDGRIRRAPGAKGAMWASRVAQTVDELREKALGDALAAAGSPEAAAFRTALEPLARAHRSRIDELAAQVTALEAVQSRLDAADSLTDEGGGSSGRLARAQQTLDQLAARSPVIAESLSELRGRLDSLALVSRESESPLLIARIREARPDRPEAAMAAFRRLGSPEIGWPATTDDLKDAAPVRDALLRVAASVDDPARREELATMVRNELAARWASLAQRAADVATFEPIALAAGDFSVRTATLPPAIRFNVALTQVRRALLRPGLQEDAVRQLVAAFLAEARAIPQLPATASTRMAEVAALIDGSQPEPPSIDPLTLGPGAAGWRGETDESGKLTFTSGSARLEFIRVEVQRSGETVPVYFGVSEVSVGNFARIVAQARAQDELRRAMDVFDPGTATWAGPRSWTWNAARTVVPGPLWLKLDANVTAQRPAYPASLLRPGDFRLIRDEAGGEPNTEHPIQQLSPVAAALVARLAGCRLPATDEWRAAHLLVPLAGELSEWNLRDATFSAQLAHTRTMQGQVVNKASFPWPDSNILLPDQPKVPVHDRATAHGFNDGFLWFAPSAADPGHLIHHLIGNVAEFVFDQPDRMDAAKANADAVLSTLQQSADGLGAIGGSALSPPELSPETRVPVDLLFSTEGFADVGFRVAFTARGTRPPRETMAAKVLRVLSPDTYLFARR